MTHGQVRATDPDTSHTAAKVKRQPLRERLRTLIEGTPLGVTGHEAAAALGAPLNSITPRFAELTRAGLIEEYGERRDGQIVWRPVQELTREEISIDGKRFASFEVGANNAKCGQCAIQKHSSSCLSTPCLPSERDDRSNVIWVRIP